MEKVVLVTVKLNDNSQDWSLDEMHDELCMLTKTVHADIVDEIICRRNNPVPSLYLGKGKAQEIKEVIAQTKAQTVIFNNDLTPTQQRNLEEIFKIKTIDRTQLILDIFARHAKSQEGKLQVELAQLQYLLPRLSGKGIVLSRLGGGIGTRGPGEQKLEIDRRRIRTRINFLKKDIQILSSRRVTLRKKRSENAVPTIALVGYTNAGKSTLLNALTGARVKMKNEMFSTLDPLTRRFVLPVSGQTILFSDTVGFLHNLPHHLIDAFRTTLETATEADLLLVVVDISGGRFMQYNEAIEEVLKKLDAQKKPMVYALNKIDALDSEQSIPRLGVHKDQCIKVSAKQKINLDKLIGVIESQLSNLVKTIDVFIPHDDMKVINYIHKHGKITNNEYTEDGVKIKATLPVLIASQIISKYK